MAKLKEEKNVKKEKLQQTFDNTIRNNGFGLHVYFVKMGKDNATFTNQVKISNGIQITSPTCNKSKSRLVWEEDGTEIFITDRAESAKDRVKKLEEENKTLNTCIDNRLFGCVPATEQADHYHGPVQFTHATSLNIPDLYEEDRTNHFNNKEGIHSFQFTLFSVMAFPFIINAKKATKTAATDEDLKQLDNSIVRGNFVRSSASNPSSSSAFYIRVELNSNKKFLENLDNYISVDNQVGLRNHKDFKLDISKLYEYLNKNKDSLETVYYYVSDLLSFTEENALDNLLNLFPKKEMVQL